MVRVRDGEVFMSHAIVAEGLVKHFGKVHALDGLDLTVPEGTVLGVLGPNGAGKTTTVRILTTLLEPDAGRAEVAGVDVLRHPDDVRRRIGLSGQYAAVDETLTGRENLTMFGRLYHLGGRVARSRAEELLARFSLTDAADRRVKTYSGGMRRRLDLAAALVATPPVLFLDEPTAGLDPRGRIEMWDVINELVRGGVTLLLTTQYLEEADQLADSIVVIDRGRVIAGGTADELKAQVGGSGSKWWSRRPVTSTRRRACCGPWATASLWSTRTPTGSRCPPLAGRRSWSRWCGRSTPRTSTSSTSACTGRRWTTCSSR